MAKLPDKYKDKSFADISKNIQKNYADRYDPISQRGLMSEMTALRQEQEYQKAKQEIKANLENMLANPQPQEQQPQGMPAPEMINNQGVNPQMQPQAPDTSFNHSASQSYNQQFANGGSLFDQGLLNATLAGEMGLQNANPNGMNFNLGIGQGQQFSVNTGIAPQGNNIMRYAPLAGNVFNLLSARKPTPIQNTMARTSVDEGLATGVAPRQTQFSNIDFGNIERGINQQARSFTGNNLNASNGNAGAFMANELANQGNVMNSIAGARMQQQQGDQRTQAMNAQEQTRVDQFKQQQNMQQAQIQGQNIGLDMQMQDLNARDLGAYNTAKGANTNALFNNIGEIGREQDMMAMIANSMGYNSFGQYMQSLDPDKQKGIMDLFSSRKK